MYKSELFVYKQVTTSHSTEECQSARFIFSLIHQKSNSEAFSLTAKVSFLSFQDQEYKQFVSNGDSSGRLPCIFRGWGVGGILRACCLYCCIGRHLTYRAEEGDDQTITMMVAGPEITARLWLDHQPCLDYLAVASAQSCTLPWKKKICVTKKKVGVCKYLWSYKQLKLGYVCELVFQHHRIADINTYPHLVEREIMEKHWFFLFFKIILSCL